ncbi:MAG: ornithine carbamoyltransferase [Candidatus Altiarchaeota archaeon]
MDLLTQLEYDGKWVKGVIGDAKKLKKGGKRYSESLEGRVLTMLFMKNSTRTRVSFEAGFAQLGGHAIFLDWRTTNFDKGSLRDEIRCLDRYSDIIMARVFRHQEIVDIADAAEVPVINGLCDTYHPCQALADVMTIYEKLKRYKFKLAYTGDGNNVCNSLMIACAKVGAEMSVATPKGYEPAANAVNYAKTHGTLTLTSDPNEAAKDADVVYTDAWVGLGQEGEKDRRMKAFAGYTVTKELLGDAYFMHCLPAVRGLEATDEVLDSEKSIIYDEAENRMHAQKAVMLRLLRKKI